MHGNKNNLEASSRVMLFKSLTRFGSFFSLSLSSILIFSCLFFGLPFTFVKINITKKVPFFFYKKLLENIFNTVLTYLTNLNPNAFTSFTNKALFGILLSTSAIIKYPPVLKTLCASSKKSR